MIKEVIVVEGRDDITAVKAALECEVIATNGFGYGKSLIRTLKSLQERRGLIILTDPDFGGERIRKDLSKHIPNCKKARPNNVEMLETFDWEDILMFNLAGGKGSSERREKLGEILGIGYCNGKQILKRLNHLGVTRDEFIRAMERIDEDGE